ncbi:MAG TPA: hypothetical protein VFW21_11625 [Mycobacterium sp.]|nr:hypothetical protein [Mycobacterium sp.]
MRGWKRVALVAGVGLSAGGLSALTVVVKTPAADPDRMRDLLFLVGLLAGAWASAMTFIVLRILSRSPYFELSRAQRKAVGALMRGAATSDDPLVQWFAMRRAVANSRLRPVQWVALYATVGTVSTALAVITFGPGWWLLGGVYAVLAVAVGRAARRRVNNARRFLATAQATPPAGDLLSTVTPGHGGPATAR